jgi:hypothetical protein
VLGGQANEAVVDADRKRVLIQELGTFTQQIQQISGRLRTIEGYKFDEEKAASAESECLDVTTRLTNYIRENLDPAHLAMYASRADFVATKFTDGQQSAPLFERFQKRQAYLDLLNHTEKRLEKVIEALRR